MPSAEYERALRDCLLDCLSILDAYRQGKLYGAANGQVDALRRDIRNLYNREDCRNYGYKKEA